MLYPYNANETLQKLDTVRSLVQKIEHVDPQTTCAIIETLDALYLATQIISNSNMVLHFLDTEEELAFPKNYKHKDIDPKYNPLTHAAKGLGILLSGVADDITYTMEEQNGHLDNANLHQYTVECLVIKQNDNKIFSQVGKDLKEATQQALFKDNKDDVTVRQTAPFLDIVADWAEFIGARGQRCALRSLKQFEAENATISDITYNLVSSRDPFGRRYLIAGTDANYLKTVEGEPTSDNPTRDQREIWENSKMDFGL